MANNVALEVRGISKSYGGVMALHPLDWTVARGEVHALLGQNGCGKSTLVKALTGYHAPDGGTMIAFGREMDLPVKHPGQHGIAVIHQDLGLADGMTVFENVSVGTGYGSRLLAPVRRRRERAKAQRLVDRVGVDLRLDALVADLSPAERAMVGILRAMAVLEDHTEDQLLVLDEPTASLSRSEAGKLASFMRRLAGDGASVIFISHRLGEVLEVADTLTVLRDGRKVVTRPTAGLHEGDLVAEILGRQLDDFYPAPPELPESTQPGLVIQGLSTARLRDVSLTVRPGEIVGVTGLTGMGQEELPFAIAGAVAPERGTIALNGSELEPGNIRGAIAAGVVLVPGNRHRDGGWMEASASENLTLPALSRFASASYLRLRRERAAARRLMRESGARPQRPDMAMKLFSGGNQQKIVMSKWLQLQPRVLVLDEPTQGVDAGAAHEILEKVGGVAATGASVVIVSGDYAQLAGTCHRVLVLNEGRIVADLGGTALSEEAILLACESTGPSHAFHEPQQLPAA